MDVSKMALDLIPFRFEPIVTTLSSRLATASVDVAPFVPWLTFFLVSATLVVIACLFMGIAKLGAVMDTKSTSVDKICVGFGELQSAVKQVDDDFCSIDVGDDISDNISEMEVRYVDIPTTNSIISSGEGDSVLSMDFLESEFDDGSDAGEQSVVDSFLSDASVVTKPAKTQSGGIGVRIKKMFTSSKLVDGPPDRLLDESFEEVAASYNQTDCEKVRCSAAYSNDILVFPKSKIAIYSRPPSCSMVDCLQE